MEENENGNAQRFLELIRRSRRGKFKIYIGMIAGVGKTYRIWRPFCKSIPSWSSSMSWRIRMWRVLAIRSVGKT